MRHSSPTSSRLLGLSLAVATALLTGPSAFAHDTRLPVAADELKMSFEGPPAAQGVEFRFSGQGPILLSHDPRTDGSALLVYGTGAGADSTGLLAFDPSLWVATATGYAYSDPAGANGISSATLEQGNLSIIGDSATWPWVPAAGVDELWFHFLLEDEWLCAQADNLTATQLSNSANRIRFTDTTAPFSCPDQVCGNGLREPGELCDDGNRVDGDGCSNDCQSDACDVADFDTTYEGIQNVIFDNERYNCTDSGCHGAASAGGLNLEAGTSYGQLIDVQSTTPSVTGTGVNFLDRVEPGEPVASFLVEKLAARTRGTPTGGGGMPTIGDPLTPEHLEAIEKWIRAGAPEDLVVAETAGLLGTCLPPESPLKLDPPPAFPPPGEGIQLRSTAWALPSNFEDEICFATYYDFTQTNLVPEEDQLDCPGFGTANNPSGKCFYYDRRILRQDAQSHHSIIQIYTGATPITEAGAFGGFTYKPNYPNDPGAPTGACDPLVIDPNTGQHNDCSGAVVSGAACTGFDPVDAATNAPAFGGSQEPYAENAFAEGVYSLLPMSGVVIWNSHAFNLTQEDSTMASYLDMYFGDSNKRDFPALGIFDISKIFIQSVPPFETREYCSTFTLPPDSNVFELSSHTHRWGTRFRIWSPPNEPCNPGGFSVFPCEDNCGCGPGDPAQLLYFSTEYTDPVQLEFDPPMTFGESEQDRTLLWCSLYDNGSTPESPPVKQQSLSPEAPPFEQFGITLDVGGPCPDTDELYFGVFTKPGVMCMDGPNKGLKCGDQPAGFCDTSPGAGDGQCDACTVMGGVTTEDEMFILLGSFFVPEPSGVALAATALGTLGWLARRRRSRPESGR